MRACWLLLLAGGCAISPVGDFPAPAPPLAASDTAPPDVPPIAQKWYPVDAGSVGLLAGARSLDVMGVRLDLEAARVEEDQARRAIWPSLRPQARFFRLDGLTQGTEGEFVRVDKQNLSIGPALDLSLDIVQARTRVLAAHQRRRAAEHATEAVRRTAVLEAEERFDLLLQTQNELAITRELLEGARSVADLERAREKAGSGLLADRLRAEAHEAQAMGDVVRAQAAFRDASARLAETLRIDPRITLYAPKPAVAPVPEVLKQAKLQDLIDEALRARPEVAESVLMVEAAARELRGARAAPYVPTVFLHANLNAFGDNLGQLDDQETGSFGLVWDLSPERFGRSHVARTKLARRKLSLARTRESIVAAVVRAYGFAAVSAKAIESARRRVHASVEAVRVVKRRHDHGAVLLVEVLEAQRQLALARRELLHAVLAHNHAHRRLLHAIGR